MPAPQSNEAELPLISIVMCTYNRAHLLPETIQSLLMQRYSPVEIVVLDDGSTDDTVQVLKGYGDRLRFASQPNSGIAIARTRAAGLARGELIAFHDDDDPMPDDRLTSLYEGLSRFPEAVMAVGDWAIVDHLGAPTGERWLPESGDSEARLVIDGYGGVLWPRLPVAPHTTLFRRSDGEAIGWFDETLRYAGEDKDFFARLALRGPIVYVPQIVSYLRRGRDHQSVTSNRLRTAYWSLLLYRKHLDTARSRDTRLFRRLQQRMRKAIEQIMKLLDLDERRPEFLSAAFPADWLRLVGARERVTYSWHMYVRLPLIRVARGRPEGR